MAYNSESFAAHNQDQFDQSNLLQVVKKLHPISELNEANRAALCKSASVMHLQRNDQLKADTVFRSLVYLTDGNVTVFNGKNELNTINSGSKESYQPLTIDQSASETIKTMSMAKLIRFSREQMEILLKEQEKAATHVIDKQVTEADNAVFDSIVADMQQNAITLCSFQQTAKKIMATVKSRQVEIPDLAEIIQSDPGLTAHIILSATRAEGANTDAVQTIRGAITRLGVEATVRIAMSLPIKNSLNSNNKIITERLQEYSRRATLSAAIAQVLALKVPHLKPEMALLAGLTADLGELLVIGYADRHNEYFTTAKQLEDSIENLRDILGSWLLDSWGFSEDFIETTRTARDWYRNTNGIITYGDLVTAALIIINSQLQSSEINSIPSANNLLLTSKLQQAGIDLNSPIEILRSASQKIMVLNDLLKAS